MPNTTNKFDPDKHDDWLNCPRSRCAARNAPQNSSDFYQHCWKCGAKLPREQPVQVGEELHLEIDDMSESGQGVGKTEEGFVIFVDGAVPPVEVTVKVTRVMESYANAEIIDKRNKETSSEEQSSEDTEEEDPALGNRENFWG